MLQQLVDQALAQKSGDLLKSHFGDACTRATAGAHKITLKASLKPAADLPAAAKKANASGESSGDCFAVEAVLEEAPVKGPGAIMATQLLHKYGKRDHQGHLLGRTGQPEAIINGIIAAVQAIDPLLPTKGLKTRLYRFASDTSGRSDQGMEPKPTDDEALLKKKEERKKAAQQLAASWQSDFAADFQGGQMPKQFAVAMAQKGLLAD
ncbi:hypothetical protein COCOBI_16-2190 [Coccomyxa sp. Obi]|nr:hypothetical protein COCOBI_16-2190 [Coccomyxa sp. Obi]